MLEENTSREKIVDVNIEDQMKTAYIDYSMSVIVSRALPDVRDGLKPVHRRVLFGMHDLGVYHNKPYKKSARIVGEVLGKYHPHGDTSVYDAMVRMAQEWSLRYPLVDGQGNFGSIDGDSPAAMRYTEARLKKIAEEMLFDIEKDTVDFRFNFDDTLEEPTVMPSKIPNLLINGASGIAVGMATNMAPHNLTEVCNGIIAYLENYDITIPELMKFIKAPDFPTGAEIYGYDGIKQAYETGRGRVVMRGQANFEKDGDRDVIIVTSIPYQVNKAEMIKRTADLVNDKIIEGIYDVRDESDRQGIRIVYELKRDAVPNVVLNLLYKYTQLQSSFSINNIALVNGRPVMLNLKDIIVHFVNHRHEVIVRRTKYDLAQAEKRAHILEGLLKALDIIQEIIDLIRGSKSVDEAKQGLVEKWDFSEIQAQAIVDMRLRALTGLEREKLQNEYNELLKLIEHLNNILNSEAMRMDIIKQETIEIRDKYGDEARSEINYSGGEFNIEDIIADDQVCVTISHMGYIKRTDLTEYRVQNRGGRGSKGSDSRDEDYIEHLFTATAHEYMLFFTEQGRVFWLRVYEIPEGSKNSKGRAIQNLINITPDDKVRAFINVKNLNDAEYTNNNYIILCTKNGIIKKTSLNAYSRPRVNGINAITIREEDQLIEAKLTNGSNEIMLALRSGRAIRFPEVKVRPMGRNASGVRGVRLANESDYVIGMICVDNVESTVLVVSENGYGKRTKVDDYRITNRGGKGVKTINVTEKTGLLAGISVVEDDHDLMIINKSGIIIRLAVADMRVMGRATQGVRLINLKENDSIASITTVLTDEDEEIDIERVKPLEINEAELEIIDVDDDDVAEEAEIEEDDVVEDDETPSDDDNE